MDSNRYSSGYRVGSQIERLIRTRRIHLFDEANPTSDICRGAWGREVLDCVKVHGQGFDGRIGHPQSSEIYASLSELELVRVQDDACLPHTC